MKIEDKSVDSVLLSSPPEDWGRVTEVMRPGAHLLLLSSVKGHHVGTIAAEDSGLEIRMLFPMFSLMVKTMWELY